MWAHRIPFMGRPRQKKELQALSTNQRAEYLQDFLYKLGNEYEKYWTKFLLAGQYL
jgi:hypothetical protein